MGVRRIHPYAAGGDLAGSRSFYTEVLGLEVAMEEPVLELQAPDVPSAQVIIPPTGFENPQPDFGGDVHAPKAVDAAYEESLRRGLTIVYPRTDEPWGVRRFFVRDPGGSIVNVLAHR